MKTKVLLATAFAIAFLAASYYPLPQHEQIVAVRLPARGFPAPVAREPAAVKKRVARKISNNDVFEKLNRESEAPWKVQRNKEGLVTKMSEGSLSLGARAPIVASAQFIQTYGQDLLGVSSADLELMDTRQEPRTTQIIYEQRLSGLPVFGSRLNMYFDRDGNLVHLVSDLLASAPTSAASLMSPAAAAAYARDALLKWLKRQGEEVHPDSYPAADLAPHAVAGYKLSGGGAVYRFAFEVTEPAHGDVEIFIDAISGEMLSFKQISKN